MHGLSDQRVFDGGDIRIDMKKTLNRLQWHASLQEYDIESTRKME